MKFLSNFLLGLCCLFLLAFSTACTHQYVKPGFVGVLVHLRGGEKGVDHEIVGVGKYYISANTELYQFPTFLQNYNYTKSPTEGKPVDESFTFQDRQGMSVNSDAGVSYQFLPDKIDFIYQKFHQGPEEITNVFLRSVIRDAFNRASSTRSIEELYGPGKSAFINEVQADVQKQALAYGIKVDKLLLINELRLPKEIASSINEKNMANQKSQQAENELKITQAEAAKTVAKAEGDAKATIVKANAEASANRIVAASITSPLIEWKRLDRWNGNYPQVLGSSAMPLFNLDIKSGKKAE